MQRFIILLFGFVLPFLSVSSPAHSQGMWSGMYLGADIGHGWGGANISIEGTTLFEMEPSGWIGSVHIGRNFQLGPLVAGLEADASFTGMEDTYILKDGSDTLTITENFNALYSIRGRLGLPVANFLLYGTAGFAWKNIDEAISFVGEVYKMNTEATELVSGHVYGGGVEMLLTPGIMLRGELLHYTMELDYSFAMGGESINILTDLNSTIGRVGFSMRF